MLKRVVPPDVAHEREAESCSSGGRRLASVGPDLEGGYAKESRGLREGKNRARKTKDRGEEMCGCVGRCVG